MTYTLCAYVHTVTHTAHVRFLCSCTAQHTYLQIVSEAACAGVHCKVGHRICINVAAPQLVQSRQHDGVTRGYFCDIHELRCHSKTDGSVH